MVKTWKAAELKIAEKLGGKRAGNTGRMGPDVLHEVYAPEVKTTRSGFPKWLTSAIAQAVRNAPEGKLPLVVLHRVGDKYDDALVVVRLKDWRDWYGDVD